MDNKSFFNSIVEGWDNIVIHDKAKVEYIVEQAKIENETFSGNIISFNSFLINDIGFETDPTKSFLVTFRTVEEQIHFLDFILYYFGMMPFPYFSYGDSMLVGVFFEQFNHSAPFELISLEQNTDTVFVTAQLIYLPASFAEIINPFHFVAIRKTYLPFRLNKIIYINDYI